MFDDIKPGDTVYLEKSIRYNCKNIGSFWLPVKVDRVTPKQFIVDGRRYKKANGSQISAGYYWSYCKKLGDKVFGGIVVDQTAEYNSLIKRIKKANFICNAAEGLKSCDYDHKNLELIYQKTVEISELLKDEEQ